MRCLYVLGLVSVVLLIGAADVLAAGQRGLFTRRSATATSGTATATTQQSQIAAYPLKKTSAAAIQTKKLVPISGIKVNSAANSTSGKEDFTSKSSSTKTVLLPKLSVAKIPASLATKSPNLVSVTPDPVAGAERHHETGRQDPESRVGHA